MAVIALERRDLDAALASFLERLEPSGAGVALRKLVDAGWDDLPPPGGGKTLQRWAALASVAAHDLSLAKLYEGHTDARAIRRELGVGPGARSSRWGTWCAESSGRRVEARPTGETSLRLSGTKPWCSGAADLTHALLTVWEEDSGPFLAAVDLGAGGVTISDGGFCAVGMADAGTVDVVFDGARAERVGARGDYLSRPGFWHGAIGVAACWYGAAARLAAFLVERMGDRPEPHGLAHLGALDASLDAARTGLWAAARAIDRAPGADASLLALRVRAVVERAVEDALRHVGRALGAAPFCKDPTFARLAADLPVFVRQSHAEKDLESLGKKVVDEREHWRL